MLFVLIGEIQSGKTRWLQSLVDELVLWNVTSWGVLAPGLWQELEEDGGLRYEKCGIDNLLLPEKKIVSFAIPCDSARPVWASEQSDSSGMEWRIRDEAIEEVNEHFDRITESIFGDVEGASRDRQREAICDSFEGVSYSKQGEKKNLLVIDELGRLELLNKRGLTSAVRLLEQGPNALYEHALVVVRASLVEEAKKRFKPAWGRLIFIEAHESARQQILDCFGITEQM